MKQKNIDIEILRIIGAFCVMFQHTGGRGATLFTTKNVPSFSFFCSIIVIIIAKIAIPIFWMIAGANLLGKDEPYSKVLKRTLRILVLLVVSELFYYFEKTGNIRLFDAKQFFVDLFSTNNNGFHLWYLCAYIALLLSLPILRLTAKGVNKKLIMYLSCIYGIFCILIPIIEGVVFSFNLHLYSAFCPLIIEYSFLPLLGYYINNQGINNKRMVYIGGAVAIVLSVMLTVVTWNINKVTWVTTFNVMIAVPVFLFVKTHTKALSAKKEKLILFLSSNTLGLYIFHIFIINKTWNWFYRINQYVHCTLISCILWLVAVFVIGILFSAILRLIPLVRKYI